MKQIKYSIMMLLALLLSAFGTAVQAQGLSGSGTAADPYVIASAADWNTFASNVTGGTSYNGQFVKLTADISVSTMAGTDANRFRGTFDGAGHTLTVNINTGETRAAPFSWVNGAIIKRLHVAGTITTSNQFAGVVGHVDGGCMIIGCHSSITINSTCSGDGTHGGFIGLNNGGTVYIINSLFDGALNGTNTTNWGGFVGWGHSSVYTIMINCVFDPANTSWDFSTSGSNTFSRNPGQATCTNCYYTKPLGDNSNANTIDASSYTNGQLQTALGGAWEIVGGKVVPVTTLQPLTGNGSADSPYLIASTTDWNNMAFNVTTLGESYDGMFLKMTSNVTVSEMVGTHELRFSGNFDGAGHTLTFNKGTSGSRFGDPYCAPFRYVKGATLRFLRIAGTIYTQNSHAAVVGNAHGNTTFLNCRSSIEINSAVNGDGTHGGFVGVIDDGHVYCFNCLFDGKLIGSSTTQCGGFIGWTDANFGPSYSDFTHCLFAPTQMTVDATNSATFSRGRNDNTSNITCTGSYYRQALGTAQGTAVGSMSDAELLAALGAGWEIADNQVVPKMSLWTGEGSTSSPYLIASAADWDMLASLVDNGITFGGQHIRLTANISVTTMLGSSAHMFGGTFDGDGHTITVTYNTTSDNVGPFCYVDNATIRNLHVAGSITTTMRYAGGIVSTCYNNMVIENCRSSVSITTNYGGDATCGGIIAVSHGTTFVTGCLFDGTFARTNGAYNCGGLAGWIDNGTTATFTDCLFAPAALAEGMLQKTLARGIQTLIFNNCYYTTAAGDVQGEQAWSVTGTPDMTLALAGMPANTYSVSGLSFYGTGNGFACNGILYGRSGDNLSLTLGLSDPAASIEDYTFAASTGTLSGTANPYTLTLAGANCQISAIAIPKYTVRLAVSTVDSNNWTIAPVVALTEGIHAGSSFTATYSGSLKVMSVKATATGAATPANIDLVPNTDSTVWTLNAMPAYGIELQVEYSDTIELTPSVNGTVWTLDSTPDYEIELQVEYAEQYKLMQVPAGWAVTADGQPVTLQGDTARIYEGAAVVLIPPDSLRRRIASVTLTDAAPAEEPVTLATPMTMEALTDGTIVVSYDVMNCTGPSMKYSLNGGDKTTISSTTTINVSAGDKVQFYGNGTSITAYDGSIGGGDYLITIAGGTASVKVYGNIMSLVDETGYETATTVAEKAFRHLFQDNSTLTDASGLLLPATTLDVYCYASMFYDCGTLTAAPALPATTLANSCYSNMFYGCTNLEAAPVLPAETLVTNCYQNMFNNCSKLASVTCMATSGINTNNSTGWWLENAGTQATGTKTFTAVSTATWPSSDSGIPSGWTRVDYTE